LDDRDVDPRGRELGEGGGGQDLELGRAETFRRLPNALEHLLEVRVVPVDLDPLTPARDVRRGVGADTQAFAREEGGGPARRGRLAVGADYVDRGKGALRGAAL